MSLAEPKERIHFRSKVEAMDQSADRQRDFDAFVMSAKGETSTKSFQDWAGGELVRHDLALRENADDGRYLAFPSQFRQIRSCRSC